MSTEQEDNSNVHRINATMRVDLNQFMRDKFWIVNNKDKVEPIYESILGFMDAFQDEAEEFLGQDPILKAINLAQPPPAVMTLTAYIPAKYWHANRQPGTGAWCIQEYVKIVRANSDPVEITKLKPGITWNAGYEPYGLAENFPSEEDDILTIWFLRNTKAEQPYGRVTIEVTLSLDEFVDDTDVVTVDVGSSPDSALDNEYFRVITAPWVVGEVKTDWCDVGVRAACAALKVESLSKFYVKLRLLHEPADAKHAIV